MAPASLRQRFLQLLGLYQPNEQHLSAITLRHRLKVVAAAFVALLLVSQISQWYLAGSGHVLLLASMGASAVLLFGLPGSPLAKPAVFLWGHLLPAAIGLACSHLFSSFPLMAAATIALVLFVMYLFEAMHPPGGATALVPVIATTTGNPPGLDFLLFPVGLNLGVMLGVSLLLQRYLRPQRLPGPGTPVTTDLPPLSRSQLQHEDLQAAMDKFQSVLDISEADLVQLFSLAQQHAQSRQHSALSCADIMAKDLVTVSPQTPLRDAWLLLRQHKISMLPVVGADERLVGVISLPDFLKDLALPELTGTRQHLRSLWLHLRRKWRIPQDQHNVSDKMSTQLVVAAPTDPITTLVPLLANNGLHHVPIVAADQTLCGVVTQSDLMAALAHQRQA
ncbi:HPP family protein [Rheinheimera texasensis]|uniref:HPP family protein n=1 Tax=Rheinheimera texasensis TaxID=306205 RepID=UPI0032B13E7A